MPFYVVGKYPTEEEVLQEAGQLASDVLQEGKRGQHHGSLNPITAKENGER